MTSEQYSLSLKLKLKLQLILFISYQLHIQLTRQRILKTAFLEYREGEINFPPTFKFIPGTQEWDTSSTPAWCGRVLYKGQDVELLEYRSQKMVVKAEHKPISCVLSINVSVSIHS